jgi:hypothetical protein
MKAWIKAFGGIALFPAILLTIRVKCRLRHARTESGGLE